MMPRCLLFYESLHILPISIRSAGAGGGLRRGDTPGDQLSRWLTGMEAALVASMRQLDDVEAWMDRAQLIMGSLSGRTPKKLLPVLIEWPLVSVSMLEHLIGVSRTAIQRNLIWMEDRHLIHEVTGQRWFRMWQIRMGSSC